MQRNFAKMKVKGFEKFENHLVSSVETYSWASHYWLRNVSYRDVEKKCFSNIVTCSVITKTDLKNTSLRLLLAWHETETSDKWHDTWPTA